MLKNHSERGESKSKLLYLKESKVSLCFLQDSKGTSTDKPPRSAHRAVHKLAQNDSFA